jgi:hypothetical protein
MSDMARHPRTLGRLILLAFVAMLASATVPTAADAYAIQGRAWPRGVVRYHSSLPASYAWSLRVAVRAWNTSGANVRLVPSSAATAQLQIRRGATGSAGGVGTLGYRRGAYLTLNRSMGAVLPERQRQPVARLIAHELGHVLGLGHPSGPGCHLMESGARPACIRDAPQAWLYDCRLLYPDDRAGLIRMYGRRSLPLQPTFCPFEPQAPAVRTLTVSGGSGGADVALAWTYPRALAAGSRVNVSVTEGACGTAPTDVALSTAVLLPTVTSWTDAASSDRPAGAYCYRVRPVNRYGWGATATARTVNTSPATPAAPVLVSLTEYSATSSADYVADVQLPANTALRVRTAPIGACAAGIGQGSVVLVSGDVSPFDLGDVPLGPQCLSFFAVDRSTDAVSSAVTRDVDHQPRPET